MNITQNFIDAANVAIHKSMTESPEVQFRTNPYVRELVHLEDDVEAYISIIFMTEEEIRQSILGDILIATMFERQSGKFFAFDMKELLKFVPEQYHQMVMTQFNHLDVQSMITSINGQLRIRDDRAVLAYVMNYSGIIYDGYGVDTTNAIFVSESVKAMDSSEVANNIINAIVGNDKSSLN